MTANGSSGSGSGSGDGDGSGSGSGSGSGNGSGNDGDGDGGGARRYRFPVSRTSPSATRGGFRDLGITPFASQLGLTPEQTNGHWCSRCEGIWFGYTLEAQCPACGNRKG